MASEEWKQTDRWLEATLRKYGSAEPRLGLETRVLAGLRMARATPAPGLSWRWPTLAVGATAALALGLFAVEQIKFVPPMPLARVLAAPPVVKSRAGHPQVGRRTAVTVDPKREQFPSPSPLTEQEQILARYVNEHYQHAVLIARAQADLARRDQMEDALSDELQFGSSNPNREKEGIR